MVFNPKILITGGAGFIGSHISQKLSIKGYKTVIADNLSSGCYENINNIDNIKFYNRDIIQDNLEDVFETENPDYVIHLAAQVGVASSFENPYFDAQMNILSCIKLIELCKSYGVKKIIVASTAAVYGDNKYIPIDEKHPVDPCSPYGLSKYTMEEYIKLSKVPYIIFRFSNVYGPRQKSYKEAGVISMFSNAMKNKEKVTIYGDGSQQRDFIYVEDIAKIFVKSIESNIENQIINFSTNKGITLNELFNTMSRIYDYDMTPEYKPKKEGDILLSILSNKLAKELFNLADSDFTDLETGLNKLKTDSENFMNCLGGGVICVLKFQL